MRASCGDRPRLSTHFSWGAPKIRAKLRRRFPDIKPPAISTVHAVLYRNGLVNRRRERHHFAQGTTLSAPTSPNDLGCADLQGRVHARRSALLLPPAANNVLQQQEKFDRFIDCYNQERPHQAIGMHYRSFTNAQCASISA